ncbi:RNA polymerase sigma-70 factor [Echinicola sp. CAU 1574]|uniref:RNA polymerase sigma-70 factor n=1 Tax=Echinicola arenosa TaxID=2774144 RepID=A0ABR9AHT0_9BACT|nr:RNA polymerase sigma-70 factor [Echinicola arenosa]MBD8488400.1 RNA polymerase sigma-70 factor [Echinicola arenosa]
MSVENTNFDEKLLLISFKKGSEVAFRALYDHFFPSLYRYALKFLKSKELAEEAVHDVFLKLWNSRERVQEDRSISPFLYKICKNHVLNLLDKAAKKPVLLREITDSQLSSLESGPEDVLIQREFENSFNIAVAKLPPVRQKVFRLCKLEGKSYEEAADILGISKGTVNSHIIKANRSLERLIKLGVSIILMILSLFFSV